MNLNKRKVWDDVLSCYRIAQSGRWDTKTKIAQLIDAGVLIETYVDEI